jgi:hypothetical protein
MLDLLNPPKFVVVSFGSVVKYNVGAILLLSCLVSIPSWPKSRKANLDMLMDESVLRIISYLFSTCISTSQYPSKIYMTGKKLKWRRTYHHPEQHFTSRITKTQIETLIRASRHPTPALYSMDGCHQVPSIYLFRP